MRDIVVNSEFGTSTLQTRSKVVKIAPGSSGTLSRGDYRSYKDFLESYSDKNSRDDQESVSSTDSGISSYKLSESKSNNTSTSSLNSETNGTSSKISQKTEQNTAFAGRTGSFRNYMESYSNKKFSSVKPVVAPKQNVIKSEIVIQVNDPLDQPKSFPKIEIPVQITTINGDEQISEVEAPPLPKSAPPSRPSNGHQNLTNTFKLPPPPPQFKKNDQHSSGAFVLPPPPPQLQKNDNHSNGTFVLPPPPVQKNGHQAEEDSVLPSPPPQLLNNGEDNVNSSTPPPPPPQPPSGCVIPPPPPPQLPDFNSSQASGKKWAPVEVDGYCSNSNSNQQEKLATNDAAANLAKILTQHLFPRRKELDGESNTVSEQPPRKSIPSPPLKNTKNASNLPAPKSPQTDQAENQKISKTSVLVSPKLPHYQRNITSPVMQAKFENSTLPRQPQKFQLPPKLPTSPPPKLPTSPQPKFESSTLPRRTQKTTLEIPAPKPFQGKAEPAAVPKQAQNVSTVELAAPKLPQTSPPKAMHGRNNSMDSVDFSTTTVVPITDTSAKVSKNDPNVRKLVYSTYRGLLGAYNNKANDMIATLPRNMVREDQGVSKQLESIALQGGLEKLNGRTNPNVEQDEGRNQ